MHHLDHVCLGDAAVGQQGRNDVLRFDARHPRECGGGTALVGIVPFDGEMFR
jgi:hypothetical protein